MFLFSITYCLAILVFAGFFIYKKIPWQPIVAFGFGSLVILVICDFVPHTFSEGSIYKNIIFILVGFLVNAFSEISLLPRIKFLNKLLPASKHDCRQHDDHHTHYHLIPTSTGCSVVACFILCTFFDGIRLFSIWMLGEIKTMVLMTFGMFLHVLPESIAVLGIGMASGLSRKSLFHLIMVFCLAFLSGFYTLFFFSRFEIAYLMAFSSGLFFYVCIVHIVPMVIKLKIKKWFFIGSTLSFILLQLSDKIAGH